MISNNLSWLIYERCKIKHEFEWYIFNQIVFVVWILLALMYSKIRLCVIMLSRIICISIWNKAKEKSCFYSSSLEGTLEIVQWCSINDETRLKNKGLLIQIEGCKVGSLYLRNW